MSDLEPNMKKIVIVGRPNVGKSTLFNRLVGRRTAVVEDQPGVTRDRLYGTFNYYRASFVLVDTGGLFADPSLPLSREAEMETLKAVREADLFLVVMDGRAGVMPHDREILNLIRTYQKPVFIVVNKVEGIALQQSFYEFYGLGGGPLFPVSAEGGTGIDDLMEAVIRALPESESATVSPETEPFAKIAIVGRPNVGKSTFINTLLGEQRHITSELPGTTRDAIDSRVAFKKRDYVFIDTAGIRRRGKIEKGVERASVSRSEEAIQRSDLVFILIDGGEGITEQDIRLVGRVIEAGKGFAIVVNKWDLRKNEAGSRKRFEAELSSDFSFIKEFPFLFISAKEGFEQGKIYQTIDDIVSSCTRRISTSDLNHYLEKILAKFPPPLYRKKPVRLNYVTQAGTKPPTFVFFTNFREGVTRSYQKFLENSLRESFGFKGTPIRLVFRQKKNIFKDA